eukprot:6087654-Alexandrium_andersonii.AAC.1
MPHGAAQREPPCALLAEATSLAAAHQADAEGNSASPSWPWLAGEAVAAAAAAAAAAAGEAGGAGAVGPAPGAQRGVLPQAGS